MQHQLLLLEVDGAVVLQCIVCSSNIISIIIILLLLFINFLFITSFLSLYCFSWLREFIDDPFRGHMVLVEFLQYLHLHPPQFYGNDETKQQTSKGSRKGKPDVFARDYVRSIFKFDFSQTNIGFCVRIFECYT